MTLNQIGAPAHEWLDCVLENCLSLEKSGDKPVLSLELAGGLIVVHLSVDEYSDSIKRNLDDESLIVSAKDWIADQLDIVKLKLDDNPSVSFVIDNAVMSL